MLHFEAEPQCTERSLLADDILGWFYVGCRFDPKISGMTVPAELVGGELAWRFWLGHKIEKIEK
jgi:hypothetical protein